MWLLRLPGLWETTSFPQNGMAKIPGVYRYYSNTGLSYKLPAPAFLQSARCYPYKVIVDNSGSPQVLLQSDRAKARAGARPRCQTIDRKRFPTK